MIRRALYQVAGVDRATIESCPATDRMWAAHLGFSLCLSFTVVLGIAYHATGYMIPDVATRVLVSLVIALTVFMFDRALYQSDWFYQGFLWGQSGQDGGGARRALRIVVRLGMSFGLAWVIALFLELAIFSDTITDRIKQEHIAANQPVFHKIEQYEAELARDIERRRTTLAALETVLRDELAAPLPAAPPPPVQLEELEQQIRALDAQDNELRAELRQILDSIKSYAAEMNAEQQGQRLSATSSGRAGAGPRYHFARQQKEVYEQQREARETELAQLRARRDDLRSTQSRILADAGARRDQARAGVEAKRDALQTQVSAARAELKDREAVRLARAAEFRQKTLAGSDFQKLKDDPLSRMTAYQALKSDPKDGATITLFSWMTKFLIIFLEIVPVVAKLFFSPPSAYAARIRAEVERERDRLRAEPVQSVADVEAGMAGIAAELRKDLVASGAPAGGAGLNENDARPVDVPWRLGKPTSTQTLAPTVPDTFQIDVEREAEKERQAISRVSGLEEVSRAYAAEEDRRREMDQLIDEDTVRRALMRAGAAH